MGVSDNSFIDTSFKISQFISPAKEWDIVTLQELVTPPSPQAILVVPIPTNFISNSIRLGLSESGEFSIKLATWVVLGLGLQKFQS